MRSRSLWFGIVRRRWGGTDSLLLRSGLVAAALALSAVPARCQNPPKASVGDYLARLHEGQWIQLSGQIRDGAVTCTDAKQLAGDLLDDDWAIRGAVQSLDVAGNEFKVGGCRIQVHASTTYDDPHRKVRGLADLRVGMLVDVEGTFMRTETFVAAEVDDESEDLEHRPALKDVLHIVGRIQKVDTRRRVVTAMGVDFQLTDKTKLRSAIR